MRKFSEINEGLLSAIRVSSQVTKTNGEIFKYFEENRDKYRTIGDVKRDLRKVAEKAYERNVKAEGAPTFNQWFGDFEKSFLNSLKNGGME